MPLPPPARRALTLQDRLRAMIAAEMRAQNVTQAELARRSRIAPPNISHYLCGRRDPGLRQLDRIATALGYELRIVFARRRS